MVTVIEGGRPDGTDLVVGEHLANPRAQAKVRGEQVVEVADLGDGFAMLGLSIESRQEGDKMVAYVVVNGCKPSTIVGIDRVVKIPIGKVGEVEHNRLKSAIATGLGETWEPPPPEPAQ